MADLLLMLACLVGMVVSLLFGPPGPTSGRFWDDGYFRITYRD